MRTQILLNTGPTTLTKTFYEDGVAADPGTVTIGIVDANGDSVVTSGTATSGTGTNPRTYALAIQVQVNVLYVTWTRSDTTANFRDVVEVIGHQLFSLAEARAFDGAAMTNTTKYPNADIVAERIRITDLLEQWTGRSWITRYCRIEAPGSGTRDLSLRTARRVASNGETVGGAGYRVGINAIIRADDGSTITVADVQADAYTGTLTRLDSTWQTPSSDDPRNVVVEYEYGTPYIDAGVDRIALLLLGDRLIKSAIPAGAISYQGEEGAMQLVREGGPHQNLTRLPEVNAWIAAHRIPLVA